MQNLDSPDDENEKKLLCQGALLQYNISESHIIENPAKSYSDYLVDGGPIWQLEHRGMTEQEAEAFRQDCERLNKLADKSS